MARALARHQLPADRRTDIVISRRFVSVLWALPCGQQRPFRIVGACGKEGDRLIGRVEHPQSQDEPHPSDPNTKVLAGDH
jgi:hypothetical protein